MCMHQDHTMSCTYTCMQKCGCSQSPYDSSSRHLPTWLSATSTYYSTCLYSTALPTGLPTLLHVKQLRTQMPYHTIVCLPGCLHAGSTCHCTSPVYHRITNWLTNTFKPPGQIHNRINSDYTHCPLCVYMLTYIANI